ncbi:Gfo/Idh/MocA family oxidoreductase [Bifidobacterium sp. MA2]|uniref:Gfo/Idh/MocA family oxidoreductase n=1 Tax=Bifidobacterium santillanense TaxID=2809028 RepID=A0ABS5UPF8_9BIFI|nr:Gfo/Idh/MocA family oxidoreductase [Bifidobacterium santillanense]MBT1172830.1 Gfo/Idh/MocA family oxidoreductase [Bifidobacterium santillanense]
MTTQGRLNGRRAEFEANGDKVNVAILGAGSIANTMATTLVAMAADPRYAGWIHPYAVAARDFERAEAFRGRYGFDKAYGSYEELVEDPMVDLVYIATPHNFHAEQAILCLKHGRNVLVEKAFTANVAQAEDLLAAADRTGLLATEAIWTRYQPSRAIINDLIASGELGDVRMVRADLSYEPHGRDRITNPNLAGGALLDVGVYALNFIDMAVGADHGRTIAGLTTTMTPYDTGVDATNATVITYDDGLMAVATSSRAVASDRSGVIEGSKGYAVVDNINNPLGIDVYGLDHEPVRHIDVPAQLTGYEYEVASAANAILDGRGECPEMPHADTLRLMGLMDRIRGEWGLVYPFEK